jgi:hypothetical protein
MTHSLPLPFRRGRPCNALVPPVQELAATQNNLPGYNLPVKTVDLEHCYVTMPDGGASSAVVVYGGLYHLEGKWLIDKIPDSLKDKFVFVLPKHFTNNCGDCIDEMLSQVGDAAIDSYSLCGYSRGGIEVYRYRMLKEWKILGLIDPSAPTMGGFEKTVLDAFSGKIRCVYWVPNWGKDGYGGKIPSFAKHLRGLKVNMVEKAVKHPDMPAFFFSQFGGDL